MSRVSNEVLIHLEKARDSALLAVEIYNRPGTSFRSGGFIVMMCIAWTSLFHAIFFKRKIQPFYRKKNNRRHFEIVDGDKKAWELSTCLDVFWKDHNSAVKLNLQFFIPLRNKIEHRSMPGLDLRIFGECQALLFNFEDLLVSEFGSRYAINESLSMALQFSCHRNEEQLMSMRKLHRALAKDVLLYVDTFRSSLSDEQLQDMQYSYKVFLIPKPANRESSSDIAVEFVKYDPNNQEQIARIKKIIALIKPTNSPKSLSGVVAEGKDGVAVRLVHDPNAPTVAGIDYDKTHPYRQKDLIGRLKELVPLVNLSPHDLVSIRYAYKVTGNRSYYYKSKFGSGQYSDQYAQWVAESIANGPNFLNDARASYRAHIRESGGR